MLHSIHKSNNLLKYLISSSCRPLHVLTSIDQVRAIRSANRDKSIGFVPTMGALHAGHIELMKHSTRDNSLTIASVFVNPTQFLPGEDFTKYPRTFEADSQKMKAVGVDYVFHPDSSIMYNPNHKTFVDIEQINNSAEGTIRPGHFRGVATIVTKLFNIVQPNSAYFGQKDGMQCLVMKRLVNELNIPVKINIISTIRESDGLAMSSRNIYLSPSDRKAAPILYKALTTAKDAYEREDVSSVKGLKARVEEVLLREKDHLSIQYISIAHLDSGEELTENIATQGAMISIACKLGSTRLIDNIIIKK
jgi:pantoate--beta-alanine ligase